MNDLRDWAKSDRTETAYVPTEAEAESLRERAADRDTKADGLEDELAELEMTIGELEKRERDLRRQMLEP